MPTLIATDGTKLKVSQEQFNKFRDWLRVESDLENRISALFRLDMYNGYELCNLNCISVLDAIRNLEKGEPFSGVKPATCFRHPPLKGLWHKHHYSGNNVPQNVENALGENGIQKLADSLKNEGISTNAMEPRCRQAAGAAVVEALKNRGHEGKLTGEWLVFAKHESENFYLSLGYHGIDDAVLFERIKKYHPDHFPELSTLVV